MGNRRFIGVVSVIALAGLVVAACGESATPLETVRSAAAMTETVKTAQISERIQGSQGPLAKGLNYVGGFDFADHRGRLSVDASGLGVPQLGSKIDAIFDYSNGLVMYMHLPQLSSELGGKQWIQMDLGALIQKAGINVNFGSIMQSESGDPASGLRLLAGASQVTVVGSEEVRGVSTTHYRVVEDLTKAVQMAPASARPELQKLVALYKSPKLPAEVWIDDQGLIRRERFTADPAQLNLPAQAQAAASASGVLTISIELYNFGAAVNATPPPADQTITLDQLLRQAAQGGGTG